LLTLTFRRDEGSGGEVLLDEGATVSVLWRADGEPHRIGAQTYEARKDGGIK
jgi:hypothetical protein